MKNKNSISLYEDSKLSYVERYDGLNNPYYVTDPRIYFSNGMTLPRGMRWFIFLLFILLNMLMNMDHGTIPAATKKIKDDLNINDDKLGIFGSLVFVGNLLGSLISFTLINAFNRKYLLLVSLVCTSVCLYTFTITTLVMVLFVNRVAVGIFQAFISIYLPVWVDQFGIRNKKAIWISLIQVAAPLGVVVGYFVTTLIQDLYDWTYSFLLQAIVIGGLILLLIFIPNKYFSTTLTVKNAPNDDVNSLQIKKTDAVTLFKENSLTEMKNDDSHSMTFYPKKVSIFGNLCLIFRQKIFMFSALALASLFFVITAVQFWASDYLQFTLKVEDKNLRLLSFSIVCITSPTLGVVMGGVVSSCIGGYESKHSILLCFVFALCAACFSVPVPLVEDSISFTVFLWLVLFFGGGILSPLTGIIITTLPKELAGSANSITSFFSNLFGYLPAPFVYGIINESFKETNSHLAMLCVMYYSFSGVILLAIAMYFRYQSFGFLTKENLIHIYSERKRSFDSRKGSSLSGNIVKVFGSYPNLDEGHEILLCGENEDETENHNTDKKDYDIKMKIVEIASSEEEKNCNEKESIENKKQEAGLYTPQFNILGPNLTSNNDTLDAASHVTFHVLNKEGSLFGEKDNLQALQRKSEDDFDVGSSQERKK